MGRAGGRCRCSTSGSQLVCRRTPAVLQNEDGLIQGPPPYRVHDRGTPQVRVGQDSETSHTGEILGRAIKASVTRRVLNRMRQRKRTQNIVTSLTLQDDEPMENLEIL